VLTIFVREGDLFRRVEENHVLRLYPPDAVEVLLGKAGFAWERLAGYDGVEISPGWHAFAAVKR
jgi:hypothetical protein